MTPQKQFLVRFVDSAGVCYYLQKSANKLCYNDYGKNKVYKNLISAARKAGEVCRKLPHPGKVEVVQVFHKPTNSELQNGFYTHEYVVVHTFTK